MIPSKFLIHECSYERFTGRGRTGPEYAPAQTARCYIDARRKRVLDAEGVERTAETTVYMLGDANTDLPVGSLMTVHGSSHKVMAVKPYELPGGSFIEVNLG